MQPKIRLYELARELGLTNAEALALCARLGIVVKSHSSSVVEAQADRVRRCAERDGLIRDVQPPEDEPAPRPKQPTNLAGNPEPAVVYEPIRLVALAHELGVTDTVIEQHCRMLGVPFTNNWTYLSPTDAHTISMRVSGRPRPSAVAIPLPAATSPVSSERGPISPSAATSPAGSQPGSSSRVGSSRRIPPPPTSRKLRNETGPTREPLRSAAIGSASESDPKRSASARRGRASGIRDIRNPPDPRTRVRVAHLADELNRPVSEILGHLKRLGIIATPDQYVTRSIAEQLANAASVELTHLKPITPPQRHLPTTHGPIPKIAGTDGRDGIVRQGAPEGVSALNAEPLNVYIDGSNVAMEKNPNPAQWLDQLNSVVEAAQAAFPNAKITVFLDASFSYRIAQATIPTHRGNVRSRTQAEFVNRGYYEVPSGVTADTVLLEAAEQPGQKSIIITNDGYHDHFDRFPWLNGTDKVYCSALNPATRRWIFQQRRILKR